MNVPNPFFTKLEAEAKLGKRVKARVDIDFMNVPLGTEGKVIDVYHCIEDSRELGIEDTDLYELIVEWASPARGVVFMLRDMYDQLLVEELN